MTPFPATATPVPTWLTAAEAAAYLRLPTTRALYKRVERGQVPAHRWGRHFRFRRAELDALLEKPRT
jgi:excisionase family DNA binding protein